MAEYLTRPAKRTKNPLISDEMIKLLNYRIQQEESSARLYLAMSMWLNNNGYSGAAKLWLKYSEEELVHSGWSRDYLLAFGVQPDTPQLVAPTQTFAGLPDIIKTTFSHEIVVSKQCNSLASSALKADDHMAYELALKFLKEQVEEHDKTQYWVDRLEAFGEDKNSLFLLDSEMGAK